MTAIGGEGKAWGCVRERHRVVGMEQLAQGSGHGPELPVREH